MNGVFCSSLIIAVCCLLRYLLFLNYGDDSFGEWVGIIVEVDQWIWKMISKRMRSEIILRLRVIWMGKIVSVLFDCCESGWYIFYDVVRMIREGIRHHLVVVVSGAIEEAGREIAAISYAWSSDILRQREVGWFISSVFMVAERMIYEMKRFVLKILEPNLLFFKF